MKISDKDNPLYIKACKRESLFRTGADDYANIKIPQRVKEFENLQKTGDRQQDEFAFLHSLGTFPRGLSLGSGGGSYELKLLQEGIVDHFVFIDISEQALETLQNNAKKLGLSEKIETRVQDFNFLDLPANSYDLVSCQNMLHHIINLEECLHEINQSLTPEGIFVTNECIGENKMYWSDAKMSFVKTFQTALAEKGIESNEYIRTSPTVLTNNCPFECIRSAELYDIIQHYFGETKVKENAYGHLWHARNALSDNRSDTYFALLETFDKFVREEKLLRPNLLFGIYKKSQKPLLETNSWSTSEMKKQIGVSRFSEQALMQRGTKTQQKLPGLYKFLKRLYFKLR